MLLITTTFARRALNITLVACLAAFLVDGHSAQAQDVFQAGDSGLYDLRTIDPDGADDPAGDEKLAIDDPRRSPLPTVGMDDGTLVIDGVAGAHEVYIIGVQGKPGAMTVHMDNWAMKIFFDVENIDVNFVAGDNFLALLQVNVEGNVEISAGDGDNGFFLGYHLYDPNLIGGDLSVLAGHGANEILFEESWVIGNADFAMGDGDNLLIAGLASSPSDLGAVVLGDLIVETGNGYDQIEIVKSWLGGNTLIDTAARDDIVLLGTHYNPGSPAAGNVFGGDLDVLTGQGNDVLGVTDNVAESRVDIAMEEGSDDLLIGTGGYPPNEFHGQFFANGGDGQDSLDDGPGNSYAHPPHFQDFESP